MKNLSIRQAQPQDIASIVALLREFAEFENLSSWCEVTEKDLSEAIFGEKSFVQSLVALEDKTYAGYALFFPIFKSFRGEQGIFLEDLYVSPNFRGNGLGLLMFKAAVGYAKKNGFVRLDWQALKWNEPALNFYKNLGAESDDENFDFRLRGAAFETLAREVIS